jgi:hypothetical protein
VTDTSVETLALEADPLQRIFTLPAHIAEDAELSTVYRASVSRMRDEARGVPMSTVQNFLIERIAFSYVQMLYRERNGQYRRPNEQKDATALWLSMTQEFNRTLEKSQEKVKEAVLSQVEDVIVAVIGQINDPEDRAKALSKLSADFAELNL